ncbi:alpha/beta hydrolase [Sphingobium sp.]|uniref:alpha/beta hydrolase n=1 Tax=Sphingobium sp. TaxID=1912891 RepID=UPI002E24DB42
MRAIARHILAWTGAIGLTLSGAAAQEVRPLYAGPAPGSENWTRPEEARKTGDGITYFNVSAPSFTAYLPPKGKANGMAVIILPGGGLRLLGVDDDTRSVIRRLNDAGIAAFLLKYRILQMPPPPPSPPRAGPMPAPKFPRMDIRNANANPAPGNAQLTQVLEMAVADTRRAMAMIRQDAAHWRIDPKRIGLMGTSAGGGVAIGTLLAQAPSDRPIFVASLYGPALQDVAVPTDAPPLFLATDSNHGAVTDGLVALFSMWKQADRPAELHSYEVPAFDFPSALWLDRFMAWLDRTFSAANR